MVLHFTAINYERSMRALKDSGGVSSHYLIPESGDPTYPDKELKVIQLVDENQRAWHAGTSYWEGRHNLNDTSIGIEIVNVPKCSENPLVPNSGKGEYGMHRLCVFPDFDAEQINLVVQLAKDILARHPDIEPTRVIGHSDISPSRKNDPGPRFPWHYLYTQGIGAWYDESTVAMYWSMFEQFQPSVKLVQQALLHYGYQIELTGVLDEQTEDVLYAFQAHFMPWAVTGELNNKTAAILFALLEKYKEGSNLYLLAKFYQEAESSWGSVDDLESEYLSVQEAFYREAGQGALTVNLFNTGEVNPPLVTVNGQAVSPESIELAKTDLQQIKTQQTFYFDFSQHTHTGHNVFSIEHDYSLGGLSWILHTPELFPSTETKNSTSINLNSSKNRRLAQELSSISKEFEVNVDVVKHGQFLISSNTIGAGGSDVWSFIATKIAIMKLVAQNKLNLERPLSDYLPWYKGSGKDNRKVIDFLLQQTGYPPISKFNLDAVAQVLTSPEQANQEYIARAREHLEPSLAQHNTELLQLNREKSSAQRLLTDAPFYYPLAQEAHFSELNLLALRLLVERMSGVSFESFVETNVFKPLGLNSLKIVKKEPVTGLLQSDVSGPMPQLLVLTEVLKYGGNYRDVQLYPKTEATQTFSPIPVWFVDSALNRFANTARDIQNLQACSAYLPKHGNLIAGTHDLILLVPTLGLTVVVTDAEGVITTGEQNRHCGLGQQQLQILEAILLAIRQIK